MTNVLLIGNGAREHAIAKAIMRSDEKPKLFAYMKSNNPGISQLCEDIQIGSYSNLEEIKAFAQAIVPDFAFIGPEDPLGHGVVDALLDIGIPCVGPKKDLAQLETSKSFTRLLMTKYKIEGNPKYKVFYDTEGLAEFLNELKEVVLKPDGLTGGKGVRVQGDHFQTLDEAYAYCEEVLREHSAVVVEEKLDGEEFSLQSFTDGITVLDSPPVQDHKRAYDGDKGPNCYSEDTEVLSENGWKTFGSLKDGERLLTYDSKTDNLLFSKPKSIYWKKYKGKMIHFKHRLLDLLVTPNHRMLIKNHKSKKNRVVTAENFIGENEIPLTGKWQGQSPEYFTLGEHDCKFNRTLNKKNISFSDWVRFMALYLSEGYVVDTPKEHRTYICQTLKSRHFKTFEKILSKLPFEVSFSSKDSKFRINSIQLVRVLKQFGSSDKKYVPDYIKNAKPKHIKEFLSAFMLGDGDYHHGRIRVCSGSKRLIDDIQEMVIKIGKSCIITVDKRQQMLNPLNGKRYKANPVYSLEVKPDRYAGIRKKDIHEIDYNGYIGCVTVSSGFIVIRRNNRVAISGNTGGMGSYSDANHLLPFLKKEHVEAAHRITVKVAQAIKEETGELYKGVMYGGFIVTKDGVKLIEYNARMGDPETMNVLTILKSDFVELCRAIVNEHLDEYDIEFERKATVCKYAVPEGYPEKPVKNEKISLKEVPKDADVFYAAVDKREDGLYMTGSRAVAFVGKGFDLEEAEVKAENAIHSAVGKIFHREDIGTQELIQKRIDHMKQVLGSGRI